MSEPKARRHVLEELIRDSGLPALSRLVWHVIAGHGTAKTGDVTAFPPSLAEIAHGAGVERRTVIDHVNLLVKEGWLHRDPGGPGRKTRYRLSSPMDPSPPLVRRGAPSDAASAGGRTKVVRDGALDSAGGRTNIVREGAPYPGCPGSPGNPSSCATEEAPAPSGSDRQEEADSPEDQTQQAAATIANHYRPTITVVEARRLTAPIAAALQRGWTPENIRHELDQPTAGLDSIAAGLIARARQLGDPPPADAQPTPRRPPWCGQCREDTRCREDPPDYRPYRCPDCHPLAATEETQ